MKRHITALSLMMLSAACATPTLANYFSNPQTNISRNIGSALSPTPNDLRVIGDSDYVPTVRPLRDYGPPPLAGVPEDRSGPLINMEGKPVFSARGAEVGYVLGVDARAGLVEVQLPSGLAIAMPASIMVQGIDRVDVPTMTQADVLAMARSQTGRTSALVIG